MKNMFKKMVSMVSAMVITLGCSISIIKNTNNTSVTAMAASESEYTELIEDMAVKFNEAREELGLEPLYIVPYLNDIAQIRAEEQPTAYSHYRPDGSFFDTVIDVDIVDYKTSGEILARGSSDVDAIFTAWKNSPKHWANITKPAATHVGIGLIYDPDSEGGWYWSAIFVGMWEDSAPLDGQRMPSAGAPTINHDDVIHPDDELLLGDVTGDGIISPSDATYALIAYTNISSGMDSGLTETQIASADVNGDGVLTGSDATMILNYANQLSSGLTPEWN